MNYNIQLDRFSPKKKYAIGMLAYPGPSEPKWNYLFGACMISFRMKSEIWFRDNCDIIVLTPTINDYSILSLIKNCFDVHATYTKPLNTKFSFKTNPRWYGVFNKLYFWNKKIFDYDKVLILDTDLFILEPVDYIAAIRDTLGPVAGCYENGYLIKNNDVNIDCLNVVIPNKYTHYKWSDGKSYYNMVNAGVISLEPNHKVFLTMIRDLESGWDKLKDKYVALKHKKNNFLFPEQEYLTGFFSGFWRSLPKKFISCETTSCHYNNHGAKYWDKFPNIYGNYKIVTEQSIKFVTIFQECITIFPNIVNNLKNIVIDTSVKSNDYPTVDVVFPSLHHKKTKQSGKAGITKVVKVNKKIELSAVNINDKNTQQKKIDNGVTQVAIKYKNNLLYQNQNIDDQNKTMKLVQSSYKKKTISITDSIDDIIFSLNNINNNNSVNIL